MVLLDTNKRKLHKAHIAIETFLYDKLDVKLKENWQVFNLYNRPLDFVGYRFYKKKPTKIRKHIFIRLHRRINKIKKTGHVTVSQARAVLSMVGWLKQTKSYNIYNNNVKPYAKLGTLKRIVSNYDKKKRSGKHDCKRQNKPQNRGT